MWLERHGGLKMKKPNLFNYATSELSQDALICYLLEFYNYKENEKEFRLSENLINEILEKVGLGVKVNQIEVIKQYKNIDVLLIINKEYYILIEDKTNTKHHSNQISRYIEKLEKEDKITENKIYGLYFKTGDESLESLEQMKKSKEDKYHEYGIMMREDILKILSSYEGSNLIINDYKEFLNEKENKQKTYNKYDDGNLIYDWDGIKGFYRKLDKEFMKLKEEGKLPNGNKGKMIGFNWGYVPNKTGGFMCYWFDNVLEFQNRSYYLQIEKINVKEKNSTGKNTRWSEDIIKYPGITLVIKVESEKRRTDILSEGLKKLKVKYEEKFKKEEFLKPNRFAPGTCMTQLLINNYIVMDNNNEIDIEKTVLKILEYIEIVKNMGKDLEHIN